MMIINPTMTPQYSTITFTDMYESVDTFIDDYKGVGIPTSISETSARTLYFLLYARYANSPIANRDIEQSKYKIFSIIFQYGPTWEKRLQIQERLRGLSEAELLEGSKAIYNHALNPGNDPSTAALDELTYIDSQNATKHQKSKLDAYAALWDMLSTDATGYFIDKFRPVFKVFVAPEDPLLYSED